MNMRIVLLSATEWDMEGKKGISIHYLADDSTRLDFPPLKASVDVSLIKSIEKRPAIYDVEMTVKVQAGKGVLTPVAFNFIKDIDIRGMLNVK